MSETPRTAPMRGPFAAAERAIRRLPGVVGVVIFGIGGDEPSEIQVFTATGVPVGEMREQVMEVLQQYEIADRIDRLYVFPLAQRLAEELGDVFGPAGTEARPTHEPVAAPAGDGRVSIRRVILSTGRAQSEAEVQLHHRGGEHGGSAVGPTTPHGLHLTARATVDAIESVLGRRGVLELAGAALLNVFGREAVCVIVSTVEDPSREFLGACLVVDAPVHEAAVRATLDAVNRQLEANFLAAQPAGEQA